MRYIFFGTPQISAVILGKLIDAGVPPAALVCNPDRPAGRKQILTPPPTKELIVNRKLQIEILQPEKLDTDFANRLRQFAPDFSIVAAYGKILPKEILDVPRLGTIGVHFSLLPKYRGASPLQTAILEGERETGVSLYLLDEKMDEGPILTQSKVQIGDRGFPELSEECANLAGDMLIRLLPEFVTGKIVPKPQDHSQATYTRKFIGRDGFVEPQDIEAAEAGDIEEAEAILRKIRALNPEPGVWTNGNLVDGKLQTAGDKRIKLLEAETENGRLKLKKIQVEGGKPISY